MKRFRRDHHGRTEVSMLPTLPFKTMEYQQESSLERFGETGILLPDYPLVELQIHVGLLWRWALKWLAFFLWGIEADLDLAWRKS